MPWDSPPATSITIPGDAGPGTTRVVITTQLPAPLDTYVASGAAGGSGKYSGGIIFYGSGDDTTYTYLCALGPAFSVSEVHFGHVRTGGVQERAAGTPDAIMINTNGSGFNTIKDIYAKLINISTGTAADTGQLMLDANGTAALRGYDPSITAAHDAMITAANNAVITASAVTLDSNGGIIHADASPSGTVQLNGSVLDLNATTTGTVYITAGLLDIDAPQLTYKAIPAAIKTGYGEGEATADLFATTASVALPGCSVTVTAAANGARYSVHVNLDVEVTVAGYGLLVGELYVNGVIQSRTLLVQGWAAGVRAPAHQQWPPLTVPAGANTFLVKIRKTINAGSIVAHQVHSSIQADLYEG
jgi:hypothetical protein